MTANSNAKLKTLYIMRMLEEETDAEHGLTMNDIITKLSEEYGITAERKSVYRDLKLLTEYGMNIRKFERNPVEYALDPRGFQLSDLMLMVDAVASSKFLTDKQADMLIGNIKSLASVSQQDQLDRSIHVAGRITAESNEVFSAIDAINQAQRERKKISFPYLHYGLDGERHLSNEGRPHVATPIEVAYDDGFYYLTAWDDDRLKICQYRIDRMESVQILDEPAVRNEEISDYTSSPRPSEYFGRFGGKEVMAKLVVGADHVEIIRDRFGSDVPIHPDPGGKTGHVLVKVYSSVQFFGWVASLDGCVTIAKPQSLVDEYHAYLRKLLGD